MRPALERWRDLAAAGAVDRLYGHSPDRLARTDADQVRRGEEFQRAGVAVLFVNRELGRSPQDALRLQVQGMMAEDERAKSLERHRRGKRHAARAGAGKVLRGAPSGYRDGPTSEGRGQAPEERRPDEARVVRQVFAGIGRARLTMGEGWRRLTRTGALPRTGKTVWDRSVVGGMGKNPASRGTAACGKTRQGPLRPQLRTQRGRPLQPRRAGSTREVPQQAWLPIPVAALVAPEVLAAVQEQLRANQRPARQARRGARYVLHGLVPCQHGG